MKLNRPQLFAICDLRAVRGVRVTSRIFPSPVTRHPSRRSGVALIVTVIMLSVITFLAVAFLALMGREKGSVKIATDQTVGRLASDTALERAKAELLATILATTNLANFDLLVSTNFVNWNGFDPGAVDSRTNVNYDYQINNNPLTAAQALQNLTSLFYNPRPPVYLTNRLAGGYEFRFYNDLNRNGRPDRTGLWPMTNNLGQAIFTNGTLVTNYLVGDPEWLGGLERPDLPHSPSNRFAYRYSYLVVPAGKTLDLNYVHNQAQAASRGGMNPNGTDFLRNEGVGTWELNLAAFLYDLNTNNVYGWGFDTVGYNYNSLNPLNPILPPIQGTAFYDAAALYRYRLNGNPSLLNYNLDPASTLYGPNGYVAFQNDGIDGYTDDRFRFSTNGASRPSPTLPVENDLPDLPWAGSPQRYHFFNPQDLFNPAKTDPVGGGNKFTDRLKMAGTNVATYDQYTYYRLLAQLGTDSAPEDPDKLNLNYVNVGGLSATNFIPWTDPDLRNGNPARGIPAFGVPGSVLFFTNVVDRLLKAYTSEWLATDSDYFTNQFQVTKGFRMINDTNFTNIPVFVNGRMVYSPAVHRVLQMAANLWDTKPNPRAAVGLPTVFRPYFTNISGNVFISSFGEIQRTNELPVLAPLDLTGATNLPASFQTDNLVYGVPLVVGARKGLPNFNEYSMESLFTLTRKIELVKSGPGGQNRITQTNQFFTLNVSLATGTEFWNSYRSNYTRPVSILVNNRVTLALTNDNNFATNRTVVVSATMATNTWPLWQSGSGNDRSFMVPLRTNIALIGPPFQKYLPGIGRFVDINAPGYEVDARLLFPRWFLSVTNRVQATVADSLGQIVDYVLLGDMNSYFDAATEIGQDPAAGDPTNPFQKLWGTNAIGNLLSGRDGVYQQILASRGSADLKTADWVGEGSWTGIRADEIAKFRAFFLPPGSTVIYTDPETGPSKPGSNGTLRAYAPFNPSVTVTVPMSWQANDPLVHYIARDMLYVEESGIARRIKPPGDTNFVVMENIGIKNKRYKPWPTEVTSKSDPDAFNLTLKDPLMTASDDWQFPTNVLPTIGWLGRIHRGTPWQTIYLKASDLGLQPQTYSTNLNNSTTWVTSYGSFANKWSRWTGNRDLRESFLTRPVTDRILFDEFTTAFDENSTRGQLPINQTGLAAWSALLSGVVTLTNNSPGRPVFAPLVVQPAGYYDSLNPSTWPPLVKIVAGINQTRANTNLFPTGTFEHLGDILAVPELSVGANPALAGNVNLGGQTFQGDLYWTNVSPFLYLGDPVLGASEKLDAAGSKTTPNQQKGLNDAAYEWLPQQVMSLLRRGEPRFVIYAYGQALHPAANSVLTTGPYFQMCTNYQITAEVATRAVVRIEGSPNPSHTNTFLPSKKRYPPRLVVESFNYLAPD